MQLSVGGLTGILHNDGYTFLPRLLGMNPWMCGAGRQTLLTSMYLVTSYVALPNN